MTYKKLLTIAMIATVMVSAGFTPAFAAKVVNESRTQDEVFAFSTGPLCGADPVDVFIEFNSFFKLWDNGHIKLHDDTQYNLYDEFGVLVGTAPLGAFNFQGNLDNLPISYNLNLGGDGTCTDGSTFEADPSFHCGATIQKDGDLIVHSVDCEL